MHWLLFQTNKYWLKKNSGLTCKKKKPQFETMDLKCRLPHRGAKKKQKSLFILQDLNNLQISELKNVEEEKLSSENITFHLLIKTMTKLFNMTGYLQPSLRTNSTV